MPDVQQDSDLTPPVLVVGFRRLKSLQAVLETVAASHRGKIYVYLDGVRPERDDDVRDCAAVRSWVHSFAEERNNVVVRASEQNVGCAHAIPNGIDWVFDTGHDEVIVLEDDCLPSPSLFPFMYELLQRYRDDERVMMISGNQFLPDEMLRGYAPSYYFSRFIHTWGWATWKRAWACYDHQMSALDDPAVLANIDALLPYADERRLYVPWWLRQRANPADTAWDSRWLLANLLASGLCICPARNLVRNIGFGDGSTHTARCNRYQLVPRQRLDMPLRHPAHVFAWRAADRLWFERLHSRSLFSRARRFLLRGRPNEVIDEV
jgi:hypothetical protein